MKTSVSAQPLVSIVMPNFNGARFLSDAIQSVLDQTYQNWELLIIDDGSIDNSTGIIETFTQNDDRIHLLQTSFEKTIPGPMAARNTGIQAAKGNYIAFLDSDDLWVPQKLSVQIPFMQKHNAAISHAWYDIIDEDGICIGQHHPSDDKCNYRTLLKGNVIGCLTAVYDANKIGKHYIDPSPGVDDFMLWLKILKHTDYSWCVHETLGQYRITAGSVSSNKLHAAHKYWMTLRNSENLGPISALYYFLYYVFYNIKKKFFKLKDDDQ